MTIVFKELEVVSEPLIVDTRFVYEPCYIYKIDEITRKFRFLRNIFKLSDSTPTLSCRCKNYVQKT